MQDWLAEGKQVEGHQYLTDKGFFIPGKMALSSTFISLFPPTPALQSIFEEFDLSYFVRNREQFKSLGVGVGA